MQDLLQSLLQLHTRDLRDGRWFIVNKYWQNRDNMMLYKKTPPWTADLTFPILLRAEWFCAATPHDDINI